MALNLISVKHITRDVNFETPTNEEYVVKGVRFKYLTEDEFNELAKTEGDDAINQLVIGWEKFIDAEKKPIRFSKTAVKELMDLRYVQVAFITVYARAIMGADSKNFAASLALGQMSMARGAKRRRSKKQARKKSLRS